MIRRLIPFPLLTLALLAMWILLTGFSPGHVLFGAAIAVMVSRTMLSLRPERPTLRIGRAAARLAFIVLIDIVRSNIAVAKIILLRPSERRSHFIEFPTALRSPDALATLAVIITATPGVTGAAVLDDAQIADLLRPWLGVDAGTLDIPLPTMIAVTRHPEAPIDLAELQRRLEAVAPGARVEDHGEWIDDALSFLRSLQFLAAALSALALGVAAMTVVFVTRTGLAIHRSVIEIVHVIGAPDAYIAQQFQAQSLRLGIVGGVIGVGLAAMTILGLDRVMGAGAVAGIMGSGSGAATADASMALDFRLLPWQWAVLALLPLAVALIAMITARLTVMRTLGRLL